MAGLGPSAHVRPSTVSMKVVNESVSKSDDHQNDHQLPVTGRGVLGVNGTAN
jgi:hypothetical protein